MRKKILAIVLSCLIGTTLCLPAMAADTSDRALERRQSENTYEMVLRENRFDSPEMPDDSVIRQEVDAYLEQIASGLQSEDLTVDNTEQLRQDQPHTASANSVSDDRFSDVSEVMVDNANDFHTALIYRNITRITLTQDITLNTTARLNRSVLIDSIDGATITSQPGERHFSVSIRTPIELSFENIILDGNNSGGGIYVNKSDVTIQGARITGCNDEMLSSASGRGGSAICAENEYVVSSNVISFAVRGSLSIQDCAIYENSGSDSAVLSIGSTEIKNTSISENECRGVCAVNLTDSSVAVTMEDVAVIDNQSLTMGGGIALIGVITNIVASNPNDGLANYINGNTAKTYGGGGVFSYPGNLTIEDTQINSNECTPLDLDTVVKGGGIMAIGRLVLIRSEVCNNQLGGTCCEGAGLYYGKTEEMNSPADDYSFLWEHEELIIIDSTIEANGSNPTSNQSNTSSSVFGGGICIAGGDAHIVGTSVSENQATFGGGICVLNSESTNQSTESIVFEDVEIIRNSAESYGGGIWGDTETLIEMESGTVGENTASNGGGVSTAGKFLLIGGVIGDNQAQIGAGINTHGSSSAGESFISIEGGSIENNTAVTTGGGIWSGNTLVISGGQIANNKTTATYGEGGGVATYGSLEMVGGTICSNESVYGGGVYAVGNMTLSRDGNAGDDSVGAVIAYNRARNGGGVMCERSAGIDSAFYMLGGEISNNQAELYGGGIEIFTGAFITGGSITNNIALRYGGGIDFAPMADCTLNLSNTDISGNSSRDGGALYSEGTLICNGCTVYTNSAANGGAFYLTEDSTIIGTDFSYNYTDYDNDRESFWRRNGNGGALYTTGDVHITRCLFYRNEAISSGGAIYIGAGTVWLHVDDEDNVGEIIYNLAGNGYGGISTEPEGTLIDEGWIILGNYPS